MIISISGTPGSGKSTLAKMLAKKLGYSHYSMGDFRRQLAREHNMTIQELNAVGEKKFWTDKEADERLKKLGETHDNLVVDSRTAYHFLPQSLKLFITVSERAGGERIHIQLKQDLMTRNEGVPQSLEDVLKRNALRMRSDHDRYKKYYNLDYLDQSNFDFVLDTTELTIEEAFAQLLKFVTKELVKKS